MSVYRKVNLIYYTMYIYIVDGNIGGGDVYWDIIDGETDIINGHCRTIYIYIHSIVYKINFTID